MRTSAPSWPTSRPGTSRRTSSAERRARVTAGSNQVYGRLGFSDWAARRSTAGAGDFTTCASRSRRSADRPFARHHVGSGGPVWASIRSPTFGTVREQSSAGCLTCWPAALAAFGLTESEPAPMPARPGPVRCSGPANGCQRQQAVHHQLGHRHHLGLHRDARTGAKTTASRRFPPSWCPR